MTLAVTIIILVGIGPFLAGRSSERSKGRSRVTSFMRIFGLTLVFYGALKIVFGI